MLPFLIRYNVGVKVLTAVPMKISIFSTMDISKEHIAFAFRADE
jgi:hypothetical protein